MNIFNKILLTSFISASLILTACTEKKTTDSTQKSAEAQPSVSSGNWQAKASELSSINGTDIKADLTQLNLIVNQSNHQATQLRDEAQSLAQDPDKLKAVLSQSNDIQKQTQEQIMGLMLKSAEVQDIRTQMIDSLMISQKLFELSTATGFNMTAPSDEFKQLAQRSMATQQKISAELDALNRQYAQ